MKQAHLILAIGVFLFLACATQPLVHKGQANSRESAARETLPISTGIDQQLRVPVGGGPTAATLAVWVLEPAKGTPVRGTVLFLHGFLATHLQVAPAGDALRKTGYRTVLVDLRGWGQSTGQHITFGVLDARDLTQLVDTLQEKKLCGKNVGVLGTSYGAASAILYAAADPRVTAVVAVAPFANIRQEVPSFSRNALGDAGVMISDSSLNALANWVSRVADLDLDAAKPVEAITKTKAQVLLIHGDIDSIVPHGASEELHHAAADHSELKTMAGRGHLDLCFDIPGELHDMAHEWFEKYLNPQ